MTISIFDIFEILERRELIQKTGMATNYCDCCTKRHVQQWYREMKTEDEFYVCIPSELAMTKYQSGQLGQLAVKDLINKLI